MTTSPSKINASRLRELRGAVHTFLQDASVYSKIRDIIDSYVAENPGDSFNPTSSADIMKIIREKGLVQDLLNRLHNEKRLAVAQTPNTTQSWKVVPGEYYLHLRLAGGKAFVDNLELTPRIAQDYMMYVAIHFGSQRYRSSFQNSSVDPPFGDEFLIDLDYKSFGSCPADLIEISTPLHIAVFREDRLLTSAKMIGENVVDWRRVLRTGYLGLTVELCGDNPGIPAGILELQLELLPNKAPRFSEEDIASRIDLQRSAITSADREFLLYARRWWMEFQEIRPAHKQRKVKVFASTSSGRMVPTTHFISVIRPETGIDTPLEAARFVSLIAVTDEEHLTQDLLLGGLGSNSSTNSWLSMFAFLSQKRGEPCNHAALLCSLLLGFGLDAYCAVGTNKKGKTAMFVVTRKRLGPGNYEIMLWEPTTGNRFALTGAHPYETLDCMFSYRSFYANIQQSDIVTMVSFDLDNEELWKPLNPLKLRMIPKYPNPSLLWIPSNTRVLEDELLTSLTKEMTEYRDIRGVITRFDENLAYVLRQTLCAYEGYRCNGTTEDLSFFEDSVKGVIGAGKTFKGVPLNVTHLNTRKILAAFESSVSGREILELNADSLTLAIQVKIYSFPEGMLSVWVMLAAAYSFTPILSKDIEGR